MTIGEALSFATHKLKNKSTSPALDGEVLISCVLGKPKEYIFAHMGKYVTPRLEKKYLAFLSQRLLGWPVAYLIKTKEFYGLKFFVNTEVLIPRPETEGLVDLVVTYLRRSPTIGKNKKLKILDIGTGSGNIIISLAKTLQLVSPPFKGETKRGSSIKTSPSPSLKGGEYLFFASDISSKALTVAKKNAKTHKVKIIFKQGSLLKPWKNQNFDVVIANLPYLAKQIDPSTKFEPKSALIAEKRGLALYEELFRTIARSEATRQSKPKYVFVEIGHDQGQQIKKLTEKYLPASPAGRPAYKTKIYKDLTRKNRYAISSLLFRRRT